MSEEQQIEAIAYRLRQCIEATDRARLPPSMENFPRGACGDSALLLGAFLQDLGHRGFEYICGERGSVDAGSWTTHAWLQRGSLVVDITADQFNDAPAAVIVADRSAWHSSFEIDRQRHVADFRVWSGPGADQLQPVYSALRIQMLGELSLGRR